MRESIMKIEKHDLLVILIFLAIILMSIYGPDDVPAYNHPTARMVKMIRER